MWDIAFELVVDKAVDLLVNLIPGFGNADEIRDAIKAAKNSSWIEFSIEVGKIVGQYTPWGKMLKIGEAGSEMYVFCKKIEKLWDKIGTWTTARTTRVWTIVKKNIKLASNANFWEYVDDLASPKFGNGATLNHLTNFDKAFPGIRSNMQIHHASPRALINKYPNLNITEVQMHSIENLRGIPNDLKITKPDGTIISMHQHLTNDIFAFVKQIDDEFGHLFVPPIR